MVAPLGVGNGCDGALNGCEALLAGLKMGAELIFNEAADEALYREFGDVVIFANAGQVCGRTAPSWRSVLSP